MTYWSRNSWISVGFGSSSSLTSPASASSSSMISLHRSMHSSQMYTPGPAMSFLTCFWLFPQKEHFSRSPPSPMRATGGHPPVSRGGAGRSGEPHEGRAVLVESLCRRYPVPPPLGGRTRRNRRDGSRWSGEHRGGLAGLDHGVDQAVLHRLRGGEDLVALDVAADLLEVAAAVVAD